MGDLECQVHEFELNLKATLYEIWEQKDNKSFYLGEN